MKKLRYYIITVASIIIAGTGTVNAQDGPIGPFGMITGMNGFGPDDMLNYSRTTGAFNTARSAAMGGAFTSLGGDLVSIGLNPAGLGMYRTSAWGFSPSITYAQMKNDFMTWSDSRTRFAPNNIGLVFNTMQKSHGLVSFSIGVSYNKAADFNFRTGFKLPAGDWSVVDIFGQQLNGLLPHLNNPNDNWIGSIPSNAMNNPWDSEKIGIDEWGSVLSYLTGAFTPVDDKNNVGQGIKKYFLSSINPNVSVTPMMRYESSGSIREWNVSGGMNFGNIFYLGFGLTLQDIYQSQKVLYTEDFAYSTVAEQKEYLRSMDYNQYTEAKGTGVNFKVGAILRPFGGLRLGIAFHSPTYTTLKHTYWANMYSVYYGQKNSSENQTYKNYYDYPYNTPARLLAGISYTIGNFAAISADYERVYYNKMKLTSDDYNMNDAFANDISSWYSAANNYRFGLEIKPIPVLALRAGYSFEDSPFRYTSENDFDAVRFNATTTNSYSAGIGVRAGKNMSIDLAYIYSITDYWRITPYFYSGDAIRVADDGNWDTAKLGIYNEDFYSGIKQHRHTFTLSFNVLF